MFRVILALFAICFLSDVCCAQCSNGICFVPQRRAAIVQRTRTVQHTAIHTRQRMIGRSWNGPVARLLRRGCR